MGKSSGAQDSGPGCPTRPHDLTAHHQHTPHNTHNVVPFFLRIPCPQPVCARDTEILGSNPNRFPHVARPGASGPHPIRYLPLPSARVRGSSAEPTYQSDIGLQMRENAIA